MQKLSADLSAHMGSDEATSMDYSVLMSVYDQEQPEHLCLSIESMLMQTSAPAQFVLVKDGPLNDALEKAITNAMKGHNKLFTIVPLKENVGLGRALDIGLQYCKYELVARMDSDDISLPQRCEKQLALFMKDPELDILGSNINEFHDDPQKPGLSRVVPSDHDAILKAIGKRHPFNHPTVMFKKSKVLASGGYGKMRRKQDLDLFSRMLFDGCKAQNIDESLVLFRSDQNSYLRRKSWSYIKSYIKVMGAILKRKQCSLGTYLFAVTGQLAFYIMPLPLMKLVSDKLLREKIQ